MFPIRSKITIGIFLSGGHAFEAEAPDVDRRSQRLHAGFHVSLVDRFDELRIDLRARLGLDLGSSATALGRSDVKLPPINSTQYKVN